MEVEAGLNRDRGGGEDGSVLARAGRTDGRSEAHRAYPAYAQASGRFSTPLPLLRRPRINTASCTRPLSIAFYSIMSDTDTITVGAYLLERLAQLGVTVRSPASPIPARSSLICFLVPLRSPWRL